MTVRSELQNQEPVWLQEKRKQAMQRSKSLPEPLPEKQDIGSISLDSFSLDELEKSNVCITTQRQSIPATIICLSLLELLQNPVYTKIFQKYFGTLVSADTKYNALHYAHVQNILFVYVPKGGEATMPIHIHKAVAGNTALHHVLIVAEPLSKIVIIEEETSSSGQTNGYMGTIVEAVVQEGAQVTYVALQNYDQHVQHYCMKRAAVAKDGRMDWIEAYFGAKYTKTTVSATLHEEGGSSTNTTIFFGEGSQKYDIISQTIQIGKHTYGDMNTVGVVTDTARSMCRGLIKIAQPSFGSSGHQKIKTLLMHKDSQANAIPSMEIDNFDVRATHESSVGQISKEKLFYLMSRGLDEQHARMKIAEGYFAQLAKLIPDKSIEQKIMGMIQKKLNLEEESQELLFEERAEEVAYV